MLPCGPTFSDRWFRWVHLFRVAQQDHWGDPAFPQVFTSCDTDPFYGSQCLPGVSNGSSSVVSICSEVSGCGLATDSVAAGETCLSCQRRDGRFCQVCANGYYPFFGSCNACPDPRGAFSLSAEPIRFRFTPISCRAAARRALH
jgi:hypothetical protein